MKDGFEQHYRLKRLRKADEVLAEVPSFPCLFFFADPPPRPLWQALERKREKMQQLEAEKKKTKK
jgi:hypothetical protein